MALRVTQSLLARGVRVARMSSAVSHTVSSSKKDERRNLTALSNGELLELIDAGKLRLHRLERELGDCARAVEVRREHLARTLVRDGRKADVSPVANLPTGAFDYKAFYTGIEGANCEAVIGYVPLPVGIVGPVIINGKSFQVPMATTEGALIASTNRGARAIAKSGGATAVILGNGMTRAPLVRCKSMAEAAKIKAWIETPQNAQALADAFNSTTSFGKLQRIGCRIAGRNLYVRFACHCGDAMGMNMVTKGSVAALALLTQSFPDIQVVSLSGNVCADKKPAAINWIEGRGRSVAAEAILTKEVVHDTLKTTVDEMISININKNFVGSAMAGAMGGFNAHAANVVAAIFLATGNDPAQVVESSNCITQMERDGENLHVSVTMPSIEVGTIGGGTVMAAQGACLDIIGCQGANRKVIGGNADSLARVVASTVLAGEISLCAALASGDLLKSHMELNRKPSTATTTTTTSAATTSSSGAAATLRAAPSHFGHPSSGGPASAAAMPQFSVVGPAPSFVAARAAGERARRSIQASPSSSHSASLFTAPASDNWYGDDGPRLPVP
jgi:hydroxymethylglutaryl-CoA reductase (NADPH)